MLYQKLIAANSQLWSDYTKHQFVDQITSGELKIEKFKFYLGQDYLYLKAYRNCFIHMAQHANTENERSYFERNTIGQIEGGMTSMFDVDTESINLSTATANYINYLNKILVAGSSLEKLVAIAPCVIGYGVLGAEIAKTEPTAGNQYQTWIDTYASNEYQDEVNQYIELLNNYQVTDEQFRTLDDIFKKVCEYEVAFFDQAIDKVKPIVMAIAGSDSGGGAGIQADIKAISANDCFAASCITAITAQSTTGVYMVEELTSNIISKQIEVVSNDLELNAIKIGMLGTVETIRAVVNSLPVDVPIVLDPVMVAKDNTKLLQDQAIDSLITELCPKTLVITPNIEEANVMLGRKIITVADMKQACIDLADLCKTNILLKGGHLNGDDLVDVLFYNNQFFEYKTKRIDTVNTHGTGCSLSSSLAARIASGESLEIATKHAIEYVQMGIVQNYPIGKGKGPINHFHCNIEIGR